VDRDLIDDFLASGAGIGGPCERRIDTPISKVFLFADRALKRKKPVDFGFLDFTTLDKRRAISVRELALNRLTAPDIYRGLHAVLPDGSGGFRLAPFETEGALDYVLEMRRFDETAVLSECPGRVDGALAETLGREVARFHGRAALGTAGGGAEGLNYVLRSNADHLRHLAAGLGAAEVERLIAATGAAFAAARPLLDQRLTQGFVRVCHGDLHLGNLLLEEGRVVLFDRIEFNDRLIEIDVLYDLAFVLMDLSFRGRGDAANRVLNGWLDEAARVFPVDALMQGLSLLPLVQSVRAAVRAHVSGHNGDITAARAYLAAALSHLERPPARLFCIGGLAGSGKSTLARALAPTLGAAPGAVILRTDEIRKRLFGQAPTEPLGPEAYAAEADAKVHGALFDAARQCLQAGVSVILDATFRDATRRAEALALAPFATGLWLDAPADVLRARVGARTNDASDADLAVLERQLVSGVSAPEWRRMDACAPLNHQCAAALTP